MTFPKYLGGMISALSLLAAASLMSAPVAADTIASKIEAQGEMTFLKVTGLRQAVRNGLLAIQAEITNDHYGQQTMHYRFRWLDSSGFSVWEDEPWKPVAFHGKDKHLIQAIAPTPQATDFRLVVQSPDNKTSPSTSSSWQLKEE